jgi:hypothetical protein
MGLFSGLGDGASWTIGAKGASASGTGEYVVVDVTVLGAKIADSKAHHRAEIVVTDKDGKALARTNTIGTLAEVLEQARAIGASGDKAVGRSAQQGGDANRWSSPGHGHGGGDAGGFDPSGMGGE